jgi:hypothetical protein
MNVLLKGSEYLKEWGEEREATLNKAMVSALQKTAYEMQGMMRADLKAAGLNLVPLIPLVKGPSKLRRKRNPLAKLWQGITYQVDKPNLSAEIGFGKWGGSMATQWQRKYAEAAMPGYTWVYSQRQREYLHTLGIHLKKSTTSAKVSSRNIIENAFALYQRKATEMLKTYFDIKASGGKW